MEKLKVTLGPVQETLLIPLWGRACATRNKSGLLDDPLAVEIVEKLDYDFTKWEKGPSGLMSVLRTRMIDDHVQQFLAQHPEGTIVEIGCGLNTRFNRLDNGTVRWFDLDLPDTIELRQQFFNDSERQTMIAGSVLDTDWIEQVKNSSGPYCFISEAVLIYLDAVEAERAVEQIATAFPGAWLLMDTTSRSIVESQSKHDAMKHLSKDSWFRWVVDNPKDLERLGLTLTSSHLYADAAPELLQHMPWWMGIITKWLPSVARRLTQGYHLNRYQISYTQVTSRC